jgi:hypothetical protein
MDLVIKKIRNSYIFKVEKATPLQVSTSNRKIGIGFTGRSPIKHGVHVFRDLGVNEGATINRNQKNNRFIVHGKSRNLIFTDPVNNRIGIGEDSPDEKLSIKDGEIEIYSTDTQFLSSEIITDNDFDDDSKFKVQGGFTITADETLTFSVPTQPEFFPSMDKDNPKNILANGNFREGSGGTASNYIWTATNDWAIKSDFLNGGKASYEYSSGSASVLAQVVINKATTPNFEYFLVLRYTISNSNITTAAKETNYKIGGANQVPLRLTGILGNYNLPTDNGDHTVYVRAAFGQGNQSAGTNHTVSLTMANTLADAIPLASGSKLDISNVSLEEIPGALIQETSDLNVTAAEFDQDEKYKFAYTISSSSGNPSLLVGAADLSGTLLGSDSIPFEDGTSSVLFDKFYVAGNHFIFLVTEVGSNQDSFTMDDISLKKLHARIRTDNGDLHIGGNLNIGSGKDATDYTLTFDGQTNDGVITWMEDEDYFKFGDDVSAGWHGDADTIKVLPRDFVGNEDAAGAAIHFDDTGTIGIIPSDAAMELYAFVPIPVGKKATHVSVFGNNTRPVNVFESNVNSGTHTSKGSGNVGTEIDITDFNHSATNYLSIKINTNAVTNVIYGATITIADIV